MEGADRNNMREACLRRVGSVIDNKYTLTTFIGMGATGAVYRAEHTNAGRVYALKIFHYHGPDEQSALQRFKREARASNKVLKNGRLHPNVVDTFDVGSDRDTGLFFIVQELLVGETLAEYLYRQEGRRIAEREALSLLAPVLDAIASAHEAGIVHRDLKPENVFLSAGPNPMEPTVKVLDFGIAQIADSRMTPTFELLGTPQYMPPEAFNGAGKVDARADVWALGAILFEMCASVPPFGDDEDGPFEVMKAITATEPVSLAAEGLLTHPTWIAVRRALTKNPAMRYRTARELADALDGVAMPIRTLRVPAGASTDTLREAIHAPAGRNTSGVHSSTRGAESDHPPPEEPGRTWWSVVFHSTDHSVNDLLELLAMPELANLVEVTVAGVALGDKGVRALVESSLLRDITVLTLRRVEMGPLGAAYLALSPTMVNLVKLDLEENAIGSDGARALVHSPTLRNIRTLSLVRTDLRPDVAEALAASPLLPKLTRLELAQNHLGDVGARALINATALDPALHLGMARNGLSQMAVEVTQSALRGRIRKVVT